MKSTLLDTSIDKRLTLDLWIAPSVYKLCQILYDIESKYYWKKNITSSAIL